MGERYQRSDADLERLLAQRPSLRLPDNFALLPRHERVALVLEEAR